MQLSFDRFPSPVGELYLVFEGDTLRVLDFDGYEPRMHRLLTAHYGRYTLEPSRAPAAITGPLSAYFSGDHEAVRTISVATGGTAFQNEVWAGLRQTAPGETMSYGGLAARLGRPKACRAVGLANGANPIAIVTPCHRIVGANGTLTGFGGGLDRKRWLLAHEGVRLPKDVAAQAELTL